MFEKGNLRQRLLPFALIPLAFLPQGGLLASANQKILTALNWQEEAPADSGAVQASWQATEITLDPGEVRAGMFFDGATVGVSALVPAGFGIAISCVGTEEPVILNRKGKALGLIWMNVGEVEIDGAPDVYLLQTSSPLSAMATPSALDSAGVGYGALESQTSLRGTEGQDQLYFREFLSLKESDGLYAVDEEAVEGVPEDGARTRVRAQLRLSPKTPPGDYRILIHGFNGEEAHLLGSAVLQVRQVGMAASIRTLAMERGLLYGILAVVVAIVVGLATGVVFGLGSKKAH